ncbi:MAG: T9SS type A sorting domain-containing protein [Bacteroidetes bacterium]|nr:T9SS type A sorting domain-containing protein [Bacteroidota bacterium]
MTDFDYYPNPAHGEFSINFNLERTLHVYCSLYDSSGRLVSILENSKLTGGQHRLIIKTHKLKNGSYTLCFNAGGSFRNKPLIIENP